MTDQATIATNLQQAMGAAQRGDFAAAATACDAALALAPDHADALQLRGLIATEQGQADRAAMLFRRSLEVSPRQPHVWNNLGNCLLTGPDWCEAGACYREALALKPDYLDAWLNLAKYLERRDDVDEALAAVGRALTLQADHPKALSEKGRLLNRLERPGEALVCLERAAALRPKAIPVLHNLGVALRQLGRVDEAVTWYRRALALRADWPELHFSLGNALADLGALEEALASYRQAIALRPDYVDAHETLNKLLWEHDRRDAFGQSVVHALEKMPQAIHLGLLQADLLRRVGDITAAAERLEQMRRRIGADPRLDHALAKIVAEQGDADQSRALFEGAMVGMPDRMDVRQDYVRLLIKMGDYGRALTILDILRERAPLDQQLLAYTGLCWRLMGDERADWLNDAVRFVQSIRLRPPSGYTDLTAFNAALRKALLPLHQTKTHPLDQTLRGGTQTKGALFTQAIPEIQHLKTGLEQTIGDYITALPDDPDHPFLSRKSNRFRFSGSWSVRLRSEGQHVNHTHAKGWISSAYYVALPDVMSTKTGQAGWLTFGESNLGLGDREMVSRLVKPEEGMLVLFPSYFFHGTVPFQSDQDRITVAFDVLPVPV